MLTTINPGPRRSNVVLNSFHSCISNTPKEFSWTPEMSFSEIVSQPRMLLHQSESRIALKQLQGFAYRHCWRQFNKQMDMVNTNLQFLNFTSMFQGNLSDKSLAVNSDAIELERVHGILAFPDKMEGILSKAMFKILQIHFFAPESAQESIAHANSMFNSRGSTEPLYTTNLSELNIEDGNSSPCLKAGVSLPWM